MFLCVKSARLLWGMWISNAIGIYAFWKYIPVVGFSVALWTLTTCFWPESPHWPASKKRFAEYALTGGLRGETKQLKRSWKSSFNPK